LLISCIDVRTLIFQPCLCRSHWPLPHPWVHTCGLPGLARQSRAWWSLAAHLWAGPSRTVLPGSGRGTSPNCRRQDQWNVDNPKLFENIRINTGLKWCLIVVIRNSVLNGKTQLIEGDKQTWPICFYWKSLTVTLTTRRINILLVECYLHNGIYLCLSLSLSWVFPSITGSE